MLGYLGPEGTFSHTAAKLFADGGETEKFNTITSLIMAVDSGELERGLVPVENSIEGGVSATLDTLFFDAEVYITAEFIMRIEENLLVKPGTRKEDIVKIMSHPQPVRQCAEFLEREFPSAVIEYTESSAEAVKIAAAGDGKIAAIGSAESAALYGMEIAAASCQDEKNNFTRFICIEKVPNKACTAGKTSIAFALSNKPGSLFEILGIFAKKRINMTKIESRPMKTELGKYIFFVDVDGSAYSENLASALKEVAQNTIACKFLGSYNQNADVPHL